MKTQLFSFFQLTAISYVNESQILVLAILKGVKNTFEATVYDFKLNQIHFFLQCTYDAYGF